MPSTSTVLTAIGSTNPVPWSRFIHALPDRPRAYTESSEWREVLNTLDALHSMELIVITRNRNTNQVISLALTGLGVERLRESEESDRLAVERKQRRIESDRVIRRYV